MAFCAIAACKSEHELSNCTLSAGFSECFCCMLSWPCRNRRSKGYGFVSFRTSEAAEAAIKSMNGRLIGHRCVLAQACVDRQVAAYTISQCAASLADNSCLLCLNVDTLWDLKCSHKQPWQMVPAMTGVHVQSIELHLLL